MTKSKTATKSYALKTGFAPPEGFVKRGPPVEMRSIDQVLEVGEAATFELKRNAAIECRDGELARYHVVLHEDQELGIWSCAMLGKALAPFDARLAEGGTVIFHAAYLGRKQYKDGQSPAHVVDVAIDPDSAAWLQDQQQDRD